MHLYSTVVTTEKHGKPVNGSACVMTLNEYIVHVEQTATKTVSNATLELLGSCSHILCNYKQRTGKTSQPFGLNLDSLDDLLTIEHQQQQEVRYSGGGKIDWCISNGKAACFIDTEQHRKTVLIDFGNQTEKKESKKTDLGKNKALSLLK